MPQISPYTQQVAPQGGLDVNANAADFGAQEGAALSQLGGSVQASGQAIQQYNEAQDVTNVHVNMAKARAEWTQNLVDRERTAQPGDETFANGMMQDMQSYFDQQAQGVQTAQGQRVFRSLAENMMSDFGQRAIGIQSDLDGKAAVNSYTQLSQAYGNTVYNDPTQLNSALAAGENAISDPNGIFARVPQTTRDQLTYNFKNDLNYAAANSYAQINPQGLLASISPANLAQFQPQQRIMQSNVTPGGQLNISPETMKQAPEVMNAAANADVNPNIVMAQLDIAKQVPGEMPAGEQMPGTLGAISQSVAALAKQYGVNTSEPINTIKGQSAYMGALLTAYGGDYTKALAAYSMGSQNFENALSRYGNQWASNIPQETQNYINEVMSRSGAVATQTPSVFDTEEQDTSGQNQQGIPSTLPFVSQLTWGQQNGLVTNAVRLQLLQQRMQDQQRMMAQQQTRQAQDLKMDGYLKQIVDPTANGMFDEKSVLADQTLAWNQKQQLIDYQFTRNREIAASANSNAHPEEVRQLMLQIHAGDNDPTKIYSMDPIMNAYRLGNLSTPEMQMLRNEVSQAKDPNNNSFQKQVQIARNAAGNFFNKNIAGVLNPAQATDAWYRFTWDLNKQIATYRAENKDPRELLDPANKRNYVLEPDRLQAYMDGSSAAITQNVSTIVNQDKGTLPSYHDFAKLKIGDSYTGPDGNVFVKH